MSTASWLLSAAVPLAELLRPKVFPPRVKEAAMSTEAEVRRLRARVVFLRGHIDRVHAATAVLVATLRVMRLQGRVPEIPELDELERVLTVPEEQA
jgi:hypothetical protein